MLKSRRHRFGMHVPVENMLSNQKSVNRPLEKGDGENGSFILPKSIQGYGRF
ncbi:MAG: hypothetical protein Q4Q37_04560 [Methanobrevibacter sp.]|nr:hypothetical protein [Methanobrevibacter sp.]